MPYSYTLMDNPDNQSQNFPDKKTMRKHIALNLPENLKENGVVVNTSNGSYFFDDAKNLESYLDIEEE